MGALSKIKQAGFDVSLDGDGFNIAPASSLTMQQRAFLKLHKTEIMAELLSVALPPKLQVFNYRVTEKPNSDLTVVMSNATLDEAKEKLIDKYDERLLTVTCYTPNGKAIEVEAASQAHAQWLKRMNPKPKGINP